MRILVTGLCLSRNLGGPAMCLTLYNELNKRIPDIDFTFAVTATSYEEELEWSKIYGLKIIRRDRLHIHLLNKFHFMGLPYFV